MADHHIHPTPAGDNIVQCIVNAWDCCGTCAGGVYAAAVRALVERAKAEAWDEGWFAAEDFVAQVSTWNASEGATDVNEPRNPYRADSLAAQPATEEGCSSCGLYGGGHAHPDCEGAQPAPEAATVDGRTAEKDLTIRTTSTGVEVIEGDCPHCGHAARDHWSDGCKGARGGADHCRMDPWKLKRLARVIPPAKPEEQP